MAVAGSGLGALPAVLDAIEDAVVFTDRYGVVRMINTRAAEMFDVDPGAHVDHPGVQLARVIARRTEDPEGYMERLQELRDDPDLELDFRIEQIIPVRRMLRVLSRPAVDARGTRIGRIELFIDISEGVARAAAAERLYEEARRTAEMYQRALLPRTVPTLPRIALVPHYIPAAGRRAVCGDFYDFLTLPNGHALIVVGDVCGIGPEAVNDAALARYTLGSHARDEDDPSALLDRANALVSFRLPSDRFIRVFVGVLDPERATLRYSNAGHVSPLLFRARTGDIERLDDANVPLGVDEGASFTASRVDLEPGDCLFVYTDGVTEAPRRGRPLGQGKLADLVRDYGVGTPGELVQAIRRAVEAWVDACTSSPGVPTP